MHRSARATRALLLVLLPVGSAAWGQAAPGPFTDGGLANDGGLAALGQGALPPPMSPRGIAIKTVTPPPSAPGCKLGDLVVSFGCPGTVQGIGIVPPAGSPDAGTPPPPTPKPETPPVVEPQVIAYCFKGQGVTVDGGTSALTTRADCSQEGEPPVVHLKNDLVLEVAGLSQIIDSANRDRKRWGLFVDGIFFPDLPPRRMDKEQVKFFVEHTQANHALWSRVLPVPWWGPTPRRMFSVGLEDASVAARPLQIPLGLYDITDVLIVLVVALGLSGGMLWLAQATPSFRDRDPTGRRDSQSPYSLARLQLAVWIWLIMVSYVALWRSLHSYDVLSRSALLILGVSGGTFLGSIAVDASKREREGRESAHRQRGRSLLKGSKSRGLWSDLVGGGEGWSLHRLQMVAWTLILMSVFINTVLIDFQMPDLTELVGLLGISATTYLGLKLPETHEAPPAGTSGTPKDTSGTPKDTGGTGGTTTGGTTTGGTTTGGTTTGGTTGTPGSTGGTGSGGIVPPATDPPKPAGPPLVKPKA